MKKAISISLFLILFFAVSFAQEKSRGLSASGSIGKKRKIIQSTSNLSDILCTISFQEPSGDNVLSEGENGMITVSVKNLSSHKTIDPKLEISVHSSWSPKPRFSTKLMESIDPGETGSYKASLKWDERLPSGAITYKAKASDLNSELTSDPVQISFNIIGKGDESSEPIFVDVDKMIPKVPVSNTKSIAVIIGNQDYSNPDVPNVDYAINDATTVKQYLINMLGFQESNIIYMENAKKADFERIFGTKDILEGKLYNWVKPNQSEVFIYYSGHGAPDMKNQKAYFMPSNCDPNYVHIDGYPLDTFYRNLEKIEAKSITVVLDACFSGGSQQGMLIKNASPMYIEVETPLLGDRFNLFTSASGDQIASWYPEGNHSLFTYYFLRAIRGEADRDRNRRLTLKEVRNFIEEHVPYMARRLYGREQTPTVNGSWDFVISTY